MKKIRLKALICCVDIFNVLIQQKFSKVYQFRCYDRHVSCILLTKLRFLLIVLLCFK